MFSDKELAAIRRLQDVVEREWETTSQEAEAARKRKTELESRCSDLSRASSALKHLTQPRDC